ncbi:MAG: phosphate acyltransferase, partial [Pseudomonadota bacterium]
MSGLILSVDGMGGDDAPDIVLDGLKRFCSQRSDVSFLVHGKANLLEPGLSSRGLTGRCEILHHDDVISMSEKPSAAFRHRNGTSLWGTLQS